MEKKTYDGLVIIWWVLFLIGFVSFSLWLLAYTFEERGGHSYVLWCVGRDGGEVSVPFKGLTSYSINPVRVCKEKMFEPIGYYVQDMEIKKFDSDYRTVDIVNGGWF